MTKYKIRSTNAVKTKAIRFHIEYDCEVMTSYEYDDWATKTFGENLLNFDEVRDRYGWLKGFNLEVRCA